MASFTFLVLPAAFYPLHEFGRRIRKISTRGQEAMAELSNFLHETFAGAKIIKAFGMETYEKKRFFQKTKMFMLFCQSICSDIPLNAGHTYTLLPQSRSVVGK